jgi:hypothetical protein
MRSRNYRHAMRWPFLAAIAVTGAVGCGPTSGDEGGPNGPGGNGQVTHLVTSRFPRLSHPQWENTVQDLFGLLEPPGLATSFDADPPLGRFDNNTARLTISAGLWQDYQRAAETMADRIAGDGEALARIVPADLPDDAAAAARAFVAAFGARAFRRPLSEAEVERYAARFQTAADHYDGLDPFTAGVRFTIEAMLQSPHFLYRSELASEASGKTIQLSGHEIASRLSYAFWNTMPDDELFAAAAAGELDTAEGVRAQALRMFDDGRTRASFAHFHEQMFALREYEDIDKSADKFPEWRRELGAMMRTEVELFLDSLIFDGEGTVGDMLTSTRTFVNDELAALYGLEGDFGEDFVEAELDAETRAGFLTRVGFLTRNATLTEPDPIHRGVFVNLEILCRPLSAVPNLPDNLMFVGETNRERIESVTGPGTCAEACHGTIINPIGFSLEHYDAIGRYRTEDNGHPVDASATYVFPDGRALTYQNAVELSHLLAAEPDPHACYLGNLLEYFYGSEVDESKFKLVSEMTDLSLGAGAPVREIVASIVTSDSFRFRPVTEQGENP